jgi:hypothetical protein
MDSTDVNQKTVYPKDWQRLQFIGELMLRLEEIRVAVRKYAEWNDATPADVPYDMLQKETIQDPKFVSYCLYNADDYIQTAISELWRAIK